MTSVSGILPYIQIGLSILLIVSILLQRSEAALGGAFGGDAFSSAQHTKRGFEKTLFTWTIALGVLFAVSAFVALIV